MEKSFCGWLLVIVNLTWCTLKRGACLWGALSSLLMEKGRPALTAWHHSGLQNYITGCELNAIPRLPLLPHCGCSRWATLCSHTQDFLSMADWPTVSPELYGNEPFLPCMASSQASCHSNKGRNQYSSWPFLQYASLKFVPNDQNSYKFLKKTCL